MHGENRAGQAERAESVPEPLPCENGAAVGFDIETTGVGADDIVTVACAWSPDREAHCFYGEDPSEVVRMLNTARHIYTFNGVQFDLPRFAKHCGAGPDTVRRWGAKTVDPLYLMKQTMGFGACIKLNDLLKENGLDPKSGSGLQAIQFWADGDRESLRAYCMDDCKLTHALCEAKEIKWAKRWILRLREARVLGFQ